MTFAPRTWVVGEVVTAALLNQEIRDQFNSFFGAWTDYSATMVWGAEGGTQPAIGNGTIVARYIKVGRTVDYLQRITLGSTSTYGDGGAGGNWYFSLPAAPSTTWSAHQTQHVVWRDNSASTRWHGVGTVSTTLHANGTLRNIQQADVASPDIWDATFPFAPAAGDIFYHQGRYESAA
ncbi:hypothetical protein [Streptomyces himalayensis]|uniref:Uncharacterized protein n=1 Tax=Streptomyces himalayensis subsp. himalayensis TaxID=2756131 RepID=A0A7W0DWD5_9ACTN|nr:hypothetical protein [Streptomyces himalayensis]MBA2951988.1 hypothetical protein [Streptomyces himalayensis subsp. himalayensis]